MDSRKRYSRRMAPAPRGYDVMPSALSARALSLAMANRRALYATSARTRDAEAELTHLRHTAEYPRPTYTPSVHSAPAGYDLMHTVASAATVAYLLQTDAVHDLAESVGAAIDEVEQTATDTSHDVTDSALSDLGGEPELVTPGPAPAGYDVMPMTENPAALVANTDTSLSNEVTPDVGIDTDHGIDVGL